MKEDEGRRAFLSIPSRRTHATLRDGVRDSCLPPDRSGFTMTGLKLSKDCENVRGYKPVWQEILDGGAKHLGGSSRHVGEVYLRGSVQLELRAAGADGIAFRILYSASYRQFRRMPASICSFRYLGKPLARMMTERRGGGLTILDGSPGEKTGILATSCRTCANGVRAAGLQSQRRRNRYCGPRFRRIIGGKHGSSGTLGLSIFRKRKKFRSRKNGSLYVRP